MDNEEYHSFCSRCYIIVLSALTAVLRLIGVIMFCIDEIYYPQNRSEGTYPVTIYLQNFRKLERQGTTAMVLNSLALSTNTFSFLLVFLVDCKKLESFSASVMNFVVVILNAIVHLMAIQLIAQNSGNEFVASVHYFTTASFTDALVEAMRFLQIPNSEQFSSSWVTRISINTFLFLMLFLIDIICLLVIFVASLSWMCSNCDARVAPREAPIRYVDYTPVKPEVEVQLEVYANNLTRVLESTEYCRYLQDELEYARDNGVELINMEVVREFIEMESIYSTPHELSLPTDSSSSTDRTSRSITPIDEVFETLKAYSVESIPSSSDYTDSDDNEDTVSTQTESIQMNLLAHAAVVHAEEYVRYVYARSEALGLPYERAEHELEQLSAVEEEDEEEEELEPQK
ncbi:hypothetical protein L3Y34_012370 [Caenorhabditis briggsae]|uniref:Uncharacterized protein n=1 Tax=Caenorhabditis briggsae TaxID=6238 RepID=A0AAE8ZR75_CAEBR|nr:hypothetical protein L3Y34_012370 [Caenorhabditis briggsae]